MSLVALVPAVLQTPARAPDIYFAPTRHAIADAMLQLVRVARDDPEPRRSEFWKLLVFNGPALDWRTFDFDRDLACADAKVERGAALGRHR